MEHAKKIIYVPREVLQKTSSDSSPLSKLDKELYDILHDKKSPDREKWMRYNQVLQRFLYLTHENRQPIPLSVVEATSADTVKDGLADVLLSTVPERYKRKAEKLYALLKKAPQKIEWTKEGVVSINGEVKQGTHIIDLVNDALRSRKNFNPEGWQDFATTLRQLNVPQELVGNVNRWNYKQRKQNISSSLRSQRGSGSLHWDSFKF